MEEFINNKNGATYDVLDNAAINATNANDGERMVVYVRDGKTFVREFSEFYTKFTKKCEQEI